jgi:hypothetical protein
MMNAFGYMEGFFSFPKYDIGEQGVRLVFFFSKKLVIIVF